MFSLSEGLQNHKKHNAPCKDSILFVFLRFCFIFFQFKDNFRASSVSFSIFCVVFFFVGCSRHLECVMLLLFSF